MDKISANCCRICLKCETSDEKLNFIEKITFSGGISAIDVLNEMFVLKLTPGELRSNSPRKLCSKCEKELENTVDLWSMAWDAQWKIAEWKEAMVACTQDSGVSITFQSDHLNDASASMVQRKKRKNEEQLTGKQQLKRANTENVDMKRVTRSQTKKALTKNDLAKATVRISQSLTITKTKSKPKNVWGKLQNCKSNESQSVKDHEENTKAQKTGKNGLTRNTRFKNTSVQIPKAPSTVKSFKETKIETRKIQKKNAVKQESPLQPLKIKTGGTRYEYDDETKKLKRKIAAYRKNVVPNADGKFPCNKCPMLLKTKETLACHLTHCYNIRPFKCELCSKAFAFSIELKGHMNVHTKLFECPVCDKKSNTKQIFMNHLRGHIKKLDNKFKCTICNIVLTTLDIVKSHILKSHPGENVDKHWHEKTEDELKLESQKLNEALIKCDVQVEEFSTENVEPSNAFENQANDYTENVQAVHLTDSELTRELWKAMNEIEGNECQSETEEIVVDNLQIPEVDLSEVSSNEDDDDDCVFEAPDPAQKNESPKAVKLCAPATFQEPMYETFDFETKAQVLESLKVAGGISMGQSYNSPSIQLLQNRNPEKHYDRRESLPDTQNSTLSPEQKMIGGRNDRQGKLQSKITLNSSLARYSRKDGKENYLGK